MNSELTRAFTIEEFRAAVFQMHPDKAPGPDGFNPAFYQKFWQLLKADVFENGVKWLMEESFPGGLNQTHVVLIPKCDRPTSMKELRPIALCNVLYKIVSKVLCNRLKIVLPGLIDQAQSAFVEGRAIQDNVLIAFEAIHSMKRKTTGKFGDMALKIDISKAYDRVDWSYLTAILRKMGFCEKWVSWMKMCVSSVEYNFLLNNEVVGPLQPGRGLRQGDPLSPYLFILCAEGLCSMINFETARGKLHGMRLGRHGPSISHLMFADDSLLFCRASVAEGETLRDLLLNYEKFSGQAINFEKSGIFFSRNVTELDRQSISAILGVTQPLNTGRYLGLPSLIGRNKKSIFSFLREKLWGRIQGWQGMKLSKAGKEVMIKAVAQAIPAYCMSTFLIPVSLTDELERMMNSFWWGNGGERSKGVKWMKWDKLCVRKDIGGMGFRNLQLFNLALLGKIGWRLTTDPNALVCRVLKAKYFPRGDFLSAEVGHSPSFTWRSIWSSQDLLRCGIRWKIGNGEKVRVFHDPWLRRAGGFFVHSFHPDDFDDMRVSELIVVGSRRWDKELVEGLLAEEEAKEVLRIPLSPVTYEDRLIWHHSRFGIYSVKSAYNLALSMTLDTNHGTNGGWKTIWSLRVPPKVKIFIWRAARNCLPTKANLLSKGITVGGECGICGTGYENAWHSFISCSFAEVCWRDSGFATHFDVCAASSESFLDFLFKMLELQEMEVISNMVMLLWQIWKDRNDAIWNNKQPRPSATLVKAATARSEWLAAQGYNNFGSAASTGQRGCVGWHDLPNGWYRCFTDAAFFGDKESTGIGIVVQGALGEFEGAKVITLPGCLRVEEGEAMGLHEALSWIKDRGLGYVEFILDSKVVVDAVHAHVEDSSEFGAIVASCRVILESCPNFHIKHARREANVAAHKLSRIAIDYPNAYVWNEPPTVVEGLLHVPCVCEQ